MATDRNTSALVESLLPDFLEVEGPKFQAFVKAYYEWMEQSGQVTDRSKNLLNYQDLDETAEEFLKYFKREILSQFPEDILANKKLVYKRIKDLYRSKGSEESYKLLFIILYDEEIDFYYPGQDILRASDGRWIKETSIRVTKPFVGNPDQLSGNITGLRSNATAKVERVQNIFEDEIDSYEIFVTNINGTFLDGETITNVQGDIQATIISKQGSLQNVIILDGGSGHQRNDIVSISSASGTGGRGRINVTDDGRIVSLSVTNAGSNFYRTDPVTIVNLTRQKFDVGGLQVNIIDGGNGYRVGTPVTLSGGGGAGAQLIVSAITNANTVSVGGNVYTFGTISNVQVVLQGAGYSSPPVATVKDTVISSLNLNDTDFTLVDGGSGYTTNATITISGGGGTGASFQIDSITNTEIVAIYTDSISGLAGTQLNASPFGSANTGSISAKLAAANINSTLLSSLDYANTVVGTIDSITRLSSGNNYTSNPSVSVIQQNVSANELPDGRGGVKGRNAVVTANIGSGFIGNTASANLLISLTNANASGAPLVTAPIQYTGRYNDIKGFLSWSNKLQDNRYYQEYSYVLRSSQMLNTYREIVKDVVHPAGMRLFGDVLINVDIDATLTLIERDNVIYTYLAPSEIFIPEVVSTTIDQYIPSGDDGALVPGPELEIELIESFFDINVAETSSDFQVEIELFAAQTSALLDNDEIISVQLQQLIENVTINTARNVLELTIAEMDAQPWSYNGVVIGPGSEVQLDVTATLLLSNVATPVLL